MVFLTTRSCGEVWASFGGETSKIIGMFMVFMGVMCVCACKTTTTDFLKTDDASLLVNMLIAAIWELKIHDDSVGWKSMAGRGSMCAGC